MSLTITASVSKKAQLKRTFSILTWALGALLILTIPLRPIDVDDAWLGDYAYWIAQVGHARTDLLANYVQYPERLLVYHKGFLVQGALLIRLFGFSIWPLKILALLYTIAGLAFTYRIAKNQTWPSWAPWAVLLLTLLHSQVFEHALIFRPDTAVMCMGLGAFYCLQRYLQLQSIAYAAGAGIFAGLAALFHLNGLAFVGATLVVLLAQNRYKAVLWAGIAAGFTAGLYTLDLWQPGRWSLYQQQLVADPALLREDLSWYRPIVSLLKEHERYFHSPREIFFSASFILLVGGQYKSLWRRHRNLMLYLFTAMLVLAIIAHGKTSKYLTYFIPFMSILMVQSIILITETSAIKRYLWRLSFIALACHIVFSLSVNIAWYSLGADGPAQRQELAHMQSLIGPAPVVGPISLSFFRAPGPSLRFWQAYQENSADGHHTFNLHKAAQEGVKFFLLEKNILGTLLPDTTGFTRLATGQHYALYKAEVR